MIIKNIEGEILFIDSSQPMGLDSHESMRLALENAVRKGVDLSGAYLRGFSLRGINLTGAKLEGAHLEDLDLEGAELGYANLKGANLKNVILEKANLKKAILDGVTWHAVRLDDADLTDASVRYSNLFHTHRKDTILTRTILTDTSLDRPAKVPDRPAPEKQGVNLKDIIVMKEKSEGGSCAGFYESTVVSVRSNKLPGSMASFVAEELSPTDTITAITYSATGDLESITVQPISCQH